MEGFGKKRDPGGFGDSMDGVEGLVDKAVESANVSAEGEVAKPEAAA